MEWMLMPLRRYADFEGRSRRQEYWMFQLGIILFYIAFVVLSVIAGAIDNSGTLGGILLIPFVIALLGIFIPALAVTVRRLHDQDKSGWWILINFIPFGGIVLLVFMCLEGTKGPNQYGPDPLGGEIEAETFE